MDRPETVQPLAEAGSQVEPADLAVEVAVVLQSSGRGAVYCMFEALSLRPEGAILRGGLLLEVNEEVTLELSLPGRAAFRTQARVVEILHGKPPAMRVVWTGKVPGAAEP